MRAAKNILMAIKPQLKTQKKEISQFKAT